MILLGFLIAVLALSLAKLFFSIDRYDQVAKLDKSSTKSDNQFEDLLFFDSKHLLAKEGN